MSGNDLSRKKRIFKDMIRLESFLTNTEHDVWNETPTLEFIKCMILFADIAGPMDYIIDLARKFKRTFAWLKDNL